jgi:glycosyltransferase involved in cell wall biosynthesis
MHEALRALNSPYFTVNYPITKPDALQLASRLKEYKPSLIQTHFLSLFNPVLRSIKHETGAQWLVVTDHSSGRVSKKSLPAEGLAWFRGRWVANYIDLVIGVSDFVCERDIAGAHIPRSKVIRIYNGIDIDRFEPPEQPSINQTITLGFIGQLTSQKGLGSLLEAIAKLRAEGFDLRLLIAGEGPQAAKFSDQVRALNIIDCVNFLGQIGDPVKFYHQLDVLIVPSEWDEAFVFVAIEASACGVCVVTSDAGGMPEIFGNADNSELSFPRGRIDVLTTLLINLIRNPAKRRQLALQTRSRVVSQFSLNTTVDNYTSQILKLLNSRRSRN